MKILVVAHSVSAGGAENALRRCVDLLRIKHTVEILFPSKTGVEISHYQGQEVPCYEISMPFALPDITSSVLGLSKIDWNSIIDPLKSKGFDLVVTNTVVMLHGGIIARILGIPHITYVHENIAEDPDLFPFGLNSDGYLKLIESQSSHMLCCSDFIRCFFPNSSTTTLYPYDFEQSVTSFDVNSRVGAFHLMVIGAKSRRKNVHFSVTLLKALRLRGHEVHLHLLGNDGSGTGTLQKHIQLRQEPNLHLYPAVPDPYALTKGLRVITLVCATAEPFGLTVVESLQRGIPVVASSSGGPNELLDAENIYQINDLDSAVRALEAVMCDYQSAALKAFENFERLRSQHTTDKECVRLESAIELAIKKFSNDHDLRLSKTWLDQLLPLMSRMHMPVLEPRIIAENVAKVSIDTHRPMGVDQVMQRVEDEVRRPGLAVQEDVRYFDVVPYADSPQMGNLYKHGLGLAIELLSTYRDEARVKMTAFVILALKSRLTLGGSPKVLALGDGLGLDAIRLAQAGFAVDYIDYDDSNMAKIAKLNCATAIKMEPHLNIQFVNRISCEYDAVVCLEVIEHVADPLGFFRSISQRIKPGGFLLISECFDGIVDRWPTHLYLNETLAARLPSFAWPDFELEDINRNPFAKPYLFKKVVRTDSLDHHSDVLGDPHVARSILSTMTRLGAM